MFAFGRMAPSTRTMPNTNPIMLDLSSIFNHFCFKFLQYISTILIYTYTAIMDEDCLIVLLILSASN